MSIGQPMQEQITGGLIKTSMALGGGTLAGTAAGFPLHEWGVFLAGLGAFGSMLIALYRFVDGKRKRDK